MTFLQERLLWHLRKHWDHESERAQRRAGVPPAQRARQRERFHSVGVADGGRRDACPTLRFIERGTELAGGRWGDGTLNFPIKAQDSGRRGKLVDRARLITANFTASPEGALG